jgi:hypothetical protein
MSLRVGATEAEREQVIAKLKAGQSFKDATAPLRAVVDPEWFVRNEKHLLGVAGKGEQKAPISDPKK